MPQSASPRRGEIWSVNLDPTIGHEIKKTRPAVIVSNNVYNQNNWVVLVVPLTSRDHAEYDQVLIEPPAGGLKLASVTLPDQLRAVDRSRLISRLGRLPASILVAIDSSLRTVLDLN